MRSDRDRLRDIEEAIQRIRKKLPPDKEVFICSDLIRVWVLYHIRVIGKAANGRSGDCKHQHQKIPWKDIIAMRHLLVHQYSGIDLDEGWNTAHKDLPLLQEEISLILKNNQTGKISAPCSRVYSPRNKSLSPPGTGRLYVRLFLVLDTLPGRDQILPGNLPHRGRDVTATRFRPAIFPKTHRIPRV